jgi:2,3-bisphosphoglycerate-independent phosphoglycerate mutase
MDNIKIPKPVVLLILDGWGITQPYSGNAISLAKTPVFNNLVENYPSMTLRASGEAVGLPWGEAGNSEVGHLNLGLGRILYQDLPKINKAISDNSFFKNKSLLKAIEHVKKNNSSLHLMGMISNGAVHSSIEHLQALLLMAKENNIKNVFIHAILDGRDTPYNSGKDFMESILKLKGDFGDINIATIMGRFYAMDRDNHWERIEKAYKAMVYGEGRKFEDPILAIEESYNKKIFDEEFVPVVINKDNEPVTKIKEGDSLIFFNYRADRAREITKSFILPGFDKFEKAKYIKDLYFVSFTEYEKELPLDIAFPSESPKNTLGQVISDKGLKQLRIAETEKYAHVTYFFNGGIEIKAEGEEHELISSPQVASYDLKPEMSAPAITKKTIEEINKDIYDFILINYANADMVGHTGNLKAAVKAIETVDSLLGKIVNSVLNKNGVILVTADHGNAESMFNMQTGMIDKEHTSNPVPFLIIGNEYEGKSIGFKEVSGNDLSLLEPQGLLSDVAPTILKILNINPPGEMTGRSLI